ncbi:MAG: hypothetical protein ACJ8CR_20065 [Roseiflexaceae bacterium]
MVLPVVIAAAIICLALVYLVQPPADYVPVPPFVPIQPLSAFTEHGVQVAITLERDHNGALVLASTYTPEDPDSHVYSKDLPRAGIDGAGRPTLLEVPPQPSVRAIGPLSADHPVLLQQFEGFSSAFPIYPDGSVTLRMPIEVTTGAATTMVDLAVTYMACSSKGYCLPPVMDKRLAVVLPNMP